MTPENEKQLDALIAAILVDNTPGMDAFVKAMLYVGTASELPPDPPKKVLPL